MTDYPIRQAINSNLSAVHVSQRHVNHIMSNITEGKKVKKKVSVAFVLMIILILAAVTALAAVTLNTYFESIAKLQQQNGYYEDWPLQQKIELLQFMESNQVADDIEQLQALLANPKESQIDQYIAEVYGIDGRLDIVTLARIVTVEKGWIGTWSPEDKAWYSQMLIENGLIGSDSYVYLLPSAEDVSPEEAISIAQNTISLQYGLTDEDWSSYTASWSYQVHVQDYGVKQPYYEIQFSPLSDNQVYYACMIANNGTVMPENEFNTLDEPTEDFDDQEAAQLFEEYMQAHPEIPSNASFGGWTLEGKQYFSEIIRPVVLQNYTEHANQTYTRVHLLAASQYMYKLPDDSAISQEKAIEIVKTALLNTFCVPQEWLAYYDGICMFYDITNPEQPLWKITVTAIGNYQTIHGIISNPYTIYKVEMDAYTGLIIRTNCFDPRENDGTLEFELQFY